jgi:GR25 family glycosyltransferase involved in LPS biosynthesis
MLGDRYVINLDRSKERLRLFQSRNAHLNNVQRFPAVDGVTIDREELIRSGYLTPDLAYPPGTLGCAMSHLKLWELAAREECVITVFEDDALVAHRFDELTARAISLLPPDWAFIKWGWRANPYFAWLDVGHSRVRLHGYGPLVYRGDAGADAFQKDTAMGVPVRMLHSYGLEAYSVSPEGARAALKFCLPLCPRLLTYPDANVRVNNTGIDVLISAFFSSVRAFVCVPSIVIEWDDAHSDRLDADRG